jgi:hypothetical protein
MSTTINCTSNNELSLVPNDSYQGRKFNEKFKNRTMKLSLNDICLASTTQKKKQLNISFKREEDFPSPTTNTTTKSNCNKSFNYGSNKLITNSTGRRASNNSNPRQ